MKTISIRQFQRNFYTELKQVPFVVLRQIWEGEDGKKTKRDVPEFVVLPYTDGSVALAKELEEKMPAPVLMVTEPEKKNILTKIQDFFRPDEK